MRKWLPLLLALFAVPVAAQITIPNTFVTNTVADPNAVNDNFTQLGTLSLNRTGGTMTGTLNAQAITPTVDATYALGSGVLRFTNAFFSGAVSSATLTATGVTTLGGIAYTWPASQTAGRVLQTNGSGTLTWATLLTVTATKVGTYTAAVGEFVVCNGTFTVNLPASASNSGAVIDVKNIGTGTITVDANAAETIDGALTITLPAQYQNTTLVSDGSNWYIR